MHRLITISWYSRYTWTLRAAEKFARASRRRERFDGRRAFKGYTSARRVFIIIVMIVIVITVHAAMRGGGGRVQDAVVFNITTCAVYVYYIHIRAEYNNNNNT